MIDVVTSPRPRAPHPKAASGRLDCVVVGYLDIDFQRYFDKQKEMSAHSGAYRDALHNSVRFGDRRLTYMNLLNESVEAGTGRPSQLSAFEVPSLGVNYLTSFLKRRGFAAESVAFVNFEEDRLADLLAEKPRAVAITTTYYVDAQPIQEIVARVRRLDPNVLIVVGGPHVYNLAAHPDLKMQDYLLQNLGADCYVVDSQGEATLCRVLEALASDGREGLARVPNLAYRDGSGGLARTARERERNDLDQNHVDWSLLDERTFDYPVFLRTARSCPFECSFCNFPAMAGEHLVAGLEGLERQFDLLHERGVSSLIFIDDTFNVPLPRFKSLLRLMIDRGYGFSWMSFFRCSNADEASFDLMAESGCKQVFLGIESGDQDILTNMNKHAKLDKYREGIAKLKERGITTYASIILGFPGETEQTVRNTLAFLEETQPDFYNVQLYYHDLRTPIHQSAEKFQIQGAGYSWRHATMDWKQAADWVDHAFANVRGSIPMTLYGFSVWAMPYLISRGIDTPRIKAFGAAARDLLVASFADRDLDVTPYRERLADVFRPVAA